MKFFKKFLLWFLVIIITLLFAVFQKITGPTYPIKGKIIIKGDTIKYRLPRSHNTRKNCRIILKNDKTISKAYLFYKRHNTNDEFTAVEMKRKNNKLIGYLPSQPPAGKLDYHIKIITSSGEKRINHKGKSIVIRFKGEVPAYILIPHIFFMFFSLMFAVRTFFEALKKKPEYLKLYLKWTFWTLIIGGAILGPIVQKYAFGAFWTGIPFGYDLTDNKTLIAIIGWLIALLKVKSNDDTKGKKWVIGAFLLMTIVYLIPHSTLGSTLDYSKMKITTGGKR